MRWAKANVQPITVLERTAYHQDHSVDADNMVLHHPLHHFGDDAGQNARTIIQQFRYEAARLEAQAQATASAAIQKEGVSHTKRWIASVKAGANVDVSNLLRDDDLVDLLSIQSEQFNSLITNLSQDVLNRIERETLGAVFEGRSNADIANSLQEVAGIGRNRARLIARDQASKLNGAMNQFRQEQAGITTYKWLGINDGRERPTHVANNNRIFRWDVPPPITGHPGHDINCRCRASGIIPDDETGEPTSPSPQPVGPDVDLETIMPILQRVGLTPTKNVFSWTAPEIAARASDLEKASQAVAALRAQTAFGESDAEKLVTSIFGYLPNDNVLADLVGGKVRSLFATRRSLLFQAAGDRLDMIGRLLTQARASVVSEAPAAVVAPETTVLTKAQAPENGLSLANPTQVADWYKDTAKLDDANKSALNRYSTGMFDQINAAVRSDAGVPDWLKPIVGEIDAALDKGTVPQGSLLYRGVRSVIGFDDVNDAFKVGGTFSDQAYLSTSTDFTEAAAFANGNNVVLVIDAGGKKGLPIGALSNFEYENEVLLERGLKFRVVADGRYVRNTAGKKLNVRIVKLVAI